MHPSVLDMFVLNASSIKEATGEKATASNCPGTRACTSVDDSSWNVSDVN